MTRNLLLGGVILGTAVALFGATVFGPSSSTPAHAVVATNGTGPRIQVTNPQPVDATHVRFDVVTAAGALPTDPQSGWNLEIKWNPTFFTYDTTLLGQLPNAGSALCPPPDSTTFESPAGSGVNMGCTTLGGTFTTLGLLATVQLSVVTPGCSLIHLNTYGPPDNGDTSTGSYTVNSDFINPQLNQGYNDATIDDLGHSSCTPGATPTPTESPTSTPVPPTNTPAATSTPTGPPTAVPSPTGTIIAGTTNIMIVNSGICTALNFPVITPGCTVQPASGLRYGAALPGDQALVQVANILGDNDSIVQPADFATVDAATARQVHQNDGAFAISLTNFAVIAFVPGNGPVYFSTTAGRFTENYSSVWLCDGTDFINPDPDCGGPNSSDTTVQPGGGGMPPYRLGPDHVVVAYLSCTLVTCPVRGAQHVTIVQDGVSYTRDFTVVGEAVRVGLSASNSSLQPGVPNDVWGQPDCPLDVHNLPSGDPRKATLTAQAFDADGTAITGAWFTFASSDVSRGVVFQYAPSVSLGAFGASALGVAAPNVACVPLGALPGTFDVTAQLSRTLLGFSADPGADPGNPGPLPATSLTLNVAIPSPTPTSTDTATSTPVPTDTPTLTSTSTPTSTDTATATSTPTPTSTRTATNTPAPTATPRPTCPGDVNDDGIVDVRDLVLVARHMGSHVGDRRYDLRFDVNHDGRINVQDLMIVLRRLGTTCR